MAAPPGGTAGYPGNAAPGMQLVPSTGALQQNVPVTTIATGLAISSAVAIGSNLVSVSRGTMTLPQALVNGLAKGALSSIILAQTRRTTIPEIVGTAGILVAAGYAIDSLTKKSATTSPHMEELEDHSL